MPRTNNAGAVTVPHNDAVIKHNKNGFVVAVTFTGGDHHGGTMRPLAGLVNLQH